MAVIQRFDYTVPMPSVASQLTDPKTGLMQPAWQRFFLSLVSPPSPVVPVDVGASPFSYQRGIPGNVLVVGGTVSAIHLIRGRDDIDTGLTAGFFPLGHNDTLVITYTVLPDVYFIPSIALSAAP